MTEIESIISELSEIIRQVQVTKGFSTVLDKEQLDDVECKALRLSAAITEYLSKAILYLEKNHSGILQRFFFVN